MFDPGGGPTMGPGSKQQAVANAENGVFCRMLSNTTSEFRLKMMPKPPLNTTLPLYTPGFQAKPMRGPKLFLSGWKSSLPLLQGVKGATGPHTAPLITPCEPNT